MLFAFLRSHRGVFYMTYYNIVRVYGLNETINIHFVKSIEIPTFLFVCSSKILYKNNEKENVYSANKYLSSTIPHISFFHFDTYKICLGFCWYRFQFTIKIKGAQGEWMMSSWTSKKKMIAKPNCSCRLLLFVCLCDYLCE